MPERPFIYIPIAERAPRSRQRRGWQSPRRRLSFPALERQAQRVIPLVRALMPAGPLQAGPAGAAPEEVLVFELAAQVDRFVTAVRNTEGLEWLAESDGVVEHEPDDDFAMVDERGEEPPSPYATRLYLIMANATALQALLDLWAVHEAVERGEAVWPRGQTAWGDALRLLRDVRRWGPRDRILDTGLMDVWAENLAAGRPTLPVEIELWFREDEQLRTEAETLVRAAIAREQGQVVTTALLPAIRYHAVLAEIPATTAQRMIEESDTGISGERAVMFLRPTGQFSAPVPSDLDEVEPIAGATPEATRADVRLALLDRLPLENHAHLAGRLIVDDPDGWSADYPAAFRKHGTAMASIILNGDASKPEEVTHERLYVRPILRPDPRALDNREAIPEGVLSVDLVHRAVLRMFEGEGAEAPSAPNVRVINFSIGDPHQLFDTLVSPMARLLDWLSWRYGVLFVVSAGNVPGVEIRLHHGPAGLHALTPEDRDRLILSSMWETSRDRRLLSPAEAMNALTVASLHQDGYTGAVTRTVEVFSSARLPSPHNTLGLGIQRSLKPDVLAPGGRPILDEALVRTHPDYTTLEPRSFVRPPGIAHAYPSSEAGRLDALAYTDGTSNAAAAVTRLAGRVCRLLEQPIVGSPDPVPESHFAVLTKALVAHSSWRPDDGLTALNQMLVDEGRSARTLRDDAGRFLGNGVVREGRALAADDDRVTLVGWGTLGADEAEIYELPLPPSLSGAIGWRRLTITLAWFSPTNPKNRRYREALLWYEPVEDLDSTIRVERAEATQMLARRGTLQHEVFEGHAAAAFVDGSVIHLRVNCRPDAGPLRDAVPYGLAITLECAPQLQLPLYEEVFARVQPRVQAPAR